MQISDGRFPAEMTPHSWVRFCENAVSVLRACHKGAWKNFDATVTRALAAIGQEFASVAPPLSISLVQLILGVLSKAGIATGPLRDYVPLVTTELTDVFPQAANLTAPFEIE